MFTRRAIPDYALPGYGIPQYALPFGVSAVSPPDVPGIEVSAGWQRPHHHVVSDRPHYSAGWRRPHYQVREEM